MELVKSYHIPRVIYIADHTDVTVSKLKLVDDMIRARIKEWLYLPV